MLSVVRAAARPFATEPPVEFAGPVDASLSDDAECEMVAALSEAQLRVDVVVQDHEVVLRVNDNGIGRPLAAAVL